MKGIGLFFSSFLVMTVLCKVCYAPDTGYNQNYDALDPNLSENFRPKQFRPQDSKRKRIDLETMAASSHTVLGVFNSTYSSPTSFPEYLPAKEGDVVIGTKTWGVYYATCTGSVTCWKLVPGTTQAYVAPVAPTPNVDSTTGAVSKIDFDEGGASTMTVDSIAPAINGNLFTSRVQTSMWTSTGTNNTAAVVVGSSTGTISFQDDDRYSGHAGASGQQSVLMTINQTEQTAGTNYTYLSKGIAVTGQGEFSIDWGNACSAADKFNVTYYNSAFTKTCAEIGSFTVSVTTSIIWSYDATQGVGNKIKIYRGNRDVTGTTVDNSITTSNGTAPLIIGRRETQAQPGAAIIDRIRILNYVASKETVANYNADLAVISKLREDLFFKWLYANYLVPGGITTIDIVNNDFFFKRGTNGIIHVDERVMKMLRESQFQGMAILAKI